MSIRDQEFNICEKDLADELGKSVDELDEIIRKIEENDKDKRRKTLREGRSFIVTNKTYNERLFSRFGAYSIAKYIDKNEKRSLFDKIKDFVTQRQKKIRQSFIKKSIHANIYPIQRIGNRNCVTKKSAIAILETSPQRFEKAFEDLKLKDPLKDGQHFVHSEGVRYYTFAGFQKLSRNLGESLTQPYRSEWCSEVAEVISKESRIIIKYLDDSEGHKNCITQAMNWVKNSRDKKRCQITSEKSSKNHKFDLSVHHIFDRKTYPHLAASPDNLITMKAEIHKEYHAWIKATRKECTIVTLMDFVANFYMDCEDAFLKLSMFKDRLGNPQPSVPRVQYLPADEPVKDSESS